MSYDGGPMTEAMYYILLALLEPGHGYRLMQAIDEYYDTLEDKNQPKALTSDPGPVQIVLSEEGRPVPPAQEKPAAKQNQDTKG